MKKLALFLIISGFFCLASCTDNLNKITSDEAAEIVASSLSSQDGGATDFIESTVTISAKKSDLLKVAASQTTLVDSTITGSFSGALRSWEYTWSYLLKANWEGAVPVSLVASHTYNGNFDGPFLSSTHSGSGTSTYTELGTGSTAQNFVVNDIWKMNGTYDRSGETTRKISGKVVSHTTHIVLTNVMVDRVNKKILSGAANITLSGNVPNKGEFTHLLTLTFNGDGTATVEVQNGKTYTVDLTTGEITTV